MKKDMTRGTEWKLILWFTLPLMAGNLLQQLYNTADGIIVGNFLGGQALAAVGTTGALAFLFIAFAIGLGVGGGVVIAQYFGAGRTADLRRAASTILLLMTAVGLLFTVLGLSFSRVLLRGLIQVPEEILDQSVLYLRIFCVGLVFQFLYNAVASMLRGVGDSRATLYFLAVASVLNVGLDLLFVAVFGWGVGGAATATVIAQGVCAAVSLTYMFRRFPDLRPDRGQPLFDWKLCKLALRLGLPTALQQSIVAVGNVGMQRLVNGFGTVSMEAYTAANRIENFATVPILGFQAGLATFSGQNMGAGRLDRVRRGMIGTQVMNLVICGAIVVLLLVFAEPVVALFGLEGESLARGVEQMHFLVPCFLLFACYQGFGGMLQGCGDVVVPSLASLTSLTLRVVLAYVLVRTGVLGYSAAWVTVPVGWVAALGISGGRYLSGKWRGKAVVRNEDGPEAA